MSDKEMRVRELLKEFGLACLNRRKEGIRAAKNKLLVELGYTPDAAPVQPGVESET